MPQAALDPNGRLFLRSKSTLTVEVDSSYEYFIAKSKEKKAQESTTLLISPALDPNMVLFEKTPLHVRFSSYAGPLDLLLDLIKRNEMDIYDIPISEITRQYLDSLANMKELDLEVAGEFLVMAATLLYIKSKVLLPGNDNEDDLEDGDPREELIRRLLEYQAFKEAAKELGFLEDERGKTFTRKISDYYLSDLDPEDAVIDTFSANLYDLLSAFQKVLTNAGKNIEHEVFEEEITIEEKIDSIKQTLETRKKVYFSDLFGETWTRNYLIITFLAILEIVKSKIAIVKQDGNFDEILIEKREVMPQIR